MLKPVTEILVVSSADDEHVTPELHPRAEPCACFDLAELPTRARLTLESGSADGALGRPSPRAAELIDLRTLGDGHMVALARLKYLLRPPPSGPRRAGPGRPPGRSMKVALLHNLRPAMTPPGAADDIFEEYDRAETIAAIAAALAEIGARVEPVALIGGSPGGWTRGRHHFAFNG